MTATLAIDFTKVVLWAVVLLYFLPVRVFRARTEMDRTAAVLRFALAVVVIVQVLSLASLLDRFSLALSLGAFCVGVVRIRYRRALRPMIVWAVDLLHVLLYDVLDAQWGVKKLLGDVLVRGRRAALRGLRGVGQTLRAHAALSCLLLIWFAVGLYDIAQDPRFVALGEYQQLLSWKRLAANQLLRAGPSPAGAHSLLHLLTSTAVIDPSVGLRMAYLLLFGLVAVMVYGVTRRHGRMGLGGALVATTLVLLLPGRLLDDIPVLNPMFDPLLLGGALVMIAALGVLPARAAGEKDRQLRWRIGIVAALACFVHPLSWLGVVLVALVSSLQRVAEQGRKAVSGALLPPAFAFLAGMPGLLLVAAQCIRDPQGVERLPLLLGLVAVQPRALSGQAATWLVGALLLGALVVGLWPGSVSARRLTAAVTFGVLALLGLASYLGRTQWLPVQTGAALALPLGCALLGIGLNIGVSMVLGRRWLSRRRVQGGLRWAGIPAAALLVGASSAMGAPDLRWEPVENHAVLQRIRRERLAFEWTVVDSYRAFPYVLGQGWVLSRLDFVTRYEPIHYRWDPREPELSVPTRDLYVFVERRPPSGLRPEAVGDLVARRVVNSLVDAWCTTYMALHDDMRIVHDSDALRVYHLHRTQARERAILKRIWRERHPRRGR